MKKLFQDLQLEPDYDPLTGDLVGVFAVNRAITGEETEILRAFLAALLPKANRQNN